MNKEHASIQPALTELERLYGHFSKRLGLNGKDRPIIIIQTVGRKNVHGWMHPSKWQGQGESDSLNEITVGAEHLTRGVEETVVTLVHEMAHHINNLEGIKDCSKEQYHNRKFKDRAEAVGLKAEKMGRFGWGKTTASPELAREIASLKVNAEAFNVFRTRDRAEKAPTKLIKWSCSCGVNVRCAVELVATCNLCDEPFIQQ